MGIGEKENFDVFSLTVQEVKRYTIPRCGSASLVNFIGKCNGACTLALQNKNNHASFGKACPGAPPPRVPLW